ncbi:hypothetical protein M2168_001923 [Streptomyces sp. CZ24]|nr:hypothetical protein [Streptomyces sp. CZ24]
MSASSTAEEQKERHPERLGPDGGGPGDDAVVLPRHGGDLQPRQLLDGRLGPPRVCRGVPHHQLQRPAADPAGRVHLVHRQLKAGEQMAARLGPAGAGQGDEGAERNGRPALGRGVGRRRRR